jgi:hypothetical protein
MQVVFFFLFLILILILVPIPVVAEAAFDAAKQSGGLRVKLFRHITVFRAVAVLEDKMLRIYTKKDRCVCVDIVETAARFLEGRRGGTPLPPARVARRATPTKKGILSYVSPRPFKLESADVFVEQGSIDNIEGTVFAGGLLNMLGGALYAALRTLTPAAEVGIHIGLAFKNNFRLYGRGIISVRIADIIFDIIRNFTRKRILRKA